MKRSIFVFLVLGATIIFFGYSKIDPLAPELGQSDQVTTSLKSLQKGDVKTSFTGTCTFVAPLDPGVTDTLPDGKIQVKEQIAQWYDEGSDSRITGKSIWYVNWLKEDELNAKIWGKAEIFVGVKDPDDEPIGKWEISWQGWQTQTSDGYKIVCDAVGEGKEGEVKGLVANWTYTMNNSLGVDSTFFYKTEGHIVEK